jgi:hypothetical protein
MPVMPITPEAAAAEPSSETPRQSILKAQMRLDELFRLWQRDSHVHPLIHLMRRYRSESQE